MQIFLTGHFQPLVVSIENSVRFHDMGIIIHDGLQCYILYFIYIFQVKHNLSLFHIFKALEITFSSHKDDYALHEDFTAV